MLKFQGCNVTPPQDASFVTTSWEQGSDTLGLLGDIPSDPSQLGCNRGVS